MIASIFHRIRPRLLLRQVFGNAVLALLFIGWLQIPDSHAWEFVCSMLAIALLAAGFLVLHAGSIQRTREAPQPLRLWLGCIMLAFWLVVAGMAARWLAGLEENTVPIYERAGYWNSQLSPHLRNVFTYPRLVTWQTDFFTTLLWWIFPTLLLPPTIESVSRGPRDVFSRAVRCVYTYWQLWSGTGVAAWIVLWAWRKLMTWHPTHTVRGELLSLVLRFAAAYLAGVMAYCLVLALIAALLAHAYARRNTAVQPSADSAKSVLCD